MKLKNPKAKGARNERRSRKLLEAIGYHVVKAGGSLGEWDLVAIGLRDVVLVQVKTNARPGRLEMFALQDFAVGHFTRKQLHRWEDGQRYPYVEEIQ